MIIQYQDELKVKQNTMDTPPENTKIIEMNEEIKVEEKEYTLSSLDYQFQSFETHLHSLQEIIHHQKEEIESLRQQVLEKTVVEQPPSFPLFDVPSLSHLQYSK